MRVESLDAALTDVLAAECIFQPVSNHRGGAFGQAVDQSAELVKMLLPNHFHDQCRSPAHCLLRPPRNPRRNEICLRPSSVGR